MKDLSMHIMDIFQNSISASATCIVLDIVEDTQNNTMILDFHDNGKGMSSEVAKQAIDPFFTTRKTRKVGLGLSLLKQNCERTGGSFQLKSKEERGTQVTAKFVLDHVDRPVSGDIPGVVVMTAIANPGIDLIYTHQRDHKSYRFSSAEVKKALGDISITEPLVYQYLNAMILENLKETGISLTS